MIKSGFISFLFLLLSVSGNAQINNSDNCKQAYKKIMMLKFDEAHNFLNSEKNNNPENPYPFYLDNYIDFLEIFISEDTEIFKSAERKKTQRISIIESISDTSPYKNYLLANLNLQWAFARLKFNEYFTAAIEINRAYRLIEINKKEFPNFYPNDITHGILQIMLGLVPDKYNWVLDLVSMEGSVEKGTDELYSALKISKTDTTFDNSRMEILFYLGFIELNVNPDKSHSIEVQNEILQMADSSLLFSYLGVNILTKTNQNAAAKVLFEKIQTMNDSYPFYYLDYLYGEFCLQNLDIENARNYYSKFLKSFRGKNYIKDAWRKMAWSFLLEGKEETYLHILSNLGTQGNRDIGKDKDAFLEYESAIIPNKNLLKAQLLFDGNHFEKADSILVNINNNELNFAEQLEKTYRLARIKHKTNSIDEAKLLYKSVIIKSELTTKYYPANSALKLGEIYELEDSLIMAKYYYEKCRNMNFDQYENSIKTKAKEGKRRVSN